MKNRSDLLKELNKIAHRWDVDVGEYLDMFGADAIQDLSDSDLRDLIEAIEFDHEEESEGDEE